MKEFEIEISDCRLCFVLGALCFAFKLMEPGVKTIKAQSTTLNLKS